ncbi:MAG: hypothetical protein V1837_01400 [Candidatus Woesearchaeota archaeon]
MKQTQCLKCHRKAEALLLCRACFGTTIEKRIRKYVRINKIFSRGDRIAAIGEINQYLIPRIIPGLPVRIFKKEQKGTKVIRNWTADDEACAFLEQVFTGKKSKRPLSIVNWTTDKELESFAKFKGLKFKPNKKNQDILKMLNTLEEKHPETKFSLIKSSQELERIGIKRKKLIS